MFGGIASQATGGDFEAGARAAAFLQATAEAAQYYESSVGQKADIRPGKNRTDDPTYEPDKYGRQLPADQQLNVFGGNNTSDTCHQGSACSQFFNAIFGMNATARLHDYWFNKPSAMPHTGWNNLWTMLPAGVISYVAVIGNATQGWQHNPIIWQQIIHE